MNDAQSTVAGLKSQECPGGGWNGMPAELEGNCTVADCLAHGTCGCIYGDAAQDLDRLRAENERLRAALTRIRDDAYTEEDEQLESEQPTMIWQLVASAALEQKVK